MTAAAISRRALRDLAAAARRIARDNPQAARALRAVPTPYRLLTLPGFPYVIIYNPARHPPVIARILHGARDLPELLRDL